MSFFTRCFVLMRDWYQILRFRMFQIVGCMVFFSIVAVILNYYGLKQVNLILGCILPFVVAFVVTAPITAGGIILAGVASRPRHPVDGTTDAFKLVGDFVAYLLLCLSFFFLVAGTFTFSRNPMALPAAYLSMFVIFLAFVVWDMKANIAKKIVYSYAVVVLVVSLGSLVSGATYWKIIGFDPYEVFKISAVDEKLDEIRKLQQKNEEKRILDVLAEIKDTLYAQNQYLNKDVPEEIRKKVDAEKKVIEKDGKLIDKDVLKKIEEKVAAEKEATKKDKELIDKVAVDTIPSKVAGKVITTYDYLVESMSQKPASPKPIQTASAPASTPAPVSFARRGVQEKVVNFKAGEPTHTGIMVQKGDVLYFINPTAPFKFSGASKFHTINKTMICDISNPGLLVINGWKEDGGVLIKVIPQS